MESHAAAEIEGLPAGFGRGLAGRAAFGIAIAFSVFQLWTAAYGTLPSQVVRAMHVGFLLLLGHAWYTTDRSPWPSVAAMVASIGITTATVLAGLA